MSDIKALALKGDFGLEDILKPDAKVRFENLFTTRHVGRVLDFFFFEAQSFFKGAENQGAIEYRYRQLMEQGVFNAWTNYRSKAAAKCVEIEVGWDGEKMAMSFTASVDSDLANFAPGQTAATDAAKRMQAMLTQMQIASDGLLIRFSPRAGRMQVIVFLSLNGARVTDKLEIAEVTPESIQPAGDVLSIRPVALSDVNPDDFEKDAVVSKQATVASGSSDPVAVTGGEVDFGSDNSLVKSANGVADASSAVQSAVEQSAEIEFIVSADAPNVQSEPEVNSSLVQMSNDELEFMQKSGDEEDDDIFGVVSGGNEAKKPAKDDRIVIKGGNTVDRANDDKLTVVKGNKIDAGNDEEIFVAGGKKVDAANDEEIVIAQGNRIDSEDDTPLFAAPPTGAPVAEPQGSLVEGLGTKTVEIDPETEKVLEETVNTAKDAIRSQMVDVIPTLSQEKYDEMFIHAARVMRENYRQTLQHMLNVQKIQAEAKMQLHAEQVSQLNKKVEELKARLGEATTAETVTTTAIDVEAENKKFEEMIDLNSINIEKLNLPPTARAWATNLLTNIMKERGDFNRRVRDFEATEKRREFEFTTAETKLKEMIRVKDEQIRQKDFTVKKTKESLTNAINSIEKLKAVEKNNDKAELQQKLYAAEKMMAVAKENSEKATKRMDEMQMKYTSEYNQRMTLSKEYSLKSKQLQDAQKKVDVLQKQVAEGKAAGNEANQKVVDTLKSQNRVLSEKITSLTASLQKAQMAGQAAARATASAGQDAGDAQIKHKLEQFNKLLKLSKDEAEKLKKRYDEVKNSETKMKVELARVQAQLRAATKK